jgi:NADPH:quinone reductase-like Zn-dependent oxidoreductase
MRAVQLTSKSGYSGLRLTTDYDPGQPGEGQVLVQLDAAGVTPLEHTISNGGLPVSASLPLVLGTEGAGVVVQSRDPQWGEGARVVFTGPYGMLRDGSWAEAVVVDVAHLARVPDGVPLATAAAMPVAYLTAYLALLQAGFSPGKSVLAPGAGGSVGNATYQLARAMGAARVMSTAGSAAKAAAARAAGMTDVIDLSVDDLAATARKLTDGSGVDVVIDALGGNITSSSLAALGFRGTAIVIGYSAGRKSLIRLTTRTSSIRRRRLSLFRLDRPDRSALPADQLAQGRAGLGRPGGAVTRGLVRAS